MIDSHAFRASPSPGEAEIVYRRLGEKTVLHQLSATSPLRLLTPQNHGCGAWVYSSSFGGGLLGGDHQHVRLRVEEGATALLGTQSSTKVYRSEAKASQTLAAHVAGEALFVSIPDPVVCFRGARYEQSARIDLDTNASLVWVESFTAGRTASGERWDAISIQSRTEIMSAGVPLLIEAMDLVAAEGSIGDAVGRFDAFSTLVMVGPRIQLLKPAFLTPSPLLKRAPVIVATSERGEAAVVRIFGESAELVFNETKRRLSGLKEVLGDDPWARKF